MPWTPAEFKKKHAHNLSAAQAKEAAHIANGMLKHGVDEGVAIATAIKHAKKSPGQKLGYNK